MTKYLVTGASGLLGRQVIQHLSTITEKADIIALVRTEMERAAFAHDGIEARLADYDDISTLIRAFSGAERALLISSPAVGRRTHQHANVIQAAKTAGTHFLAYTSMLHASASGMMLARDHVATEETLAASGIAHTVLRNTWYSENLLYSLAQDLLSGQHVGAAGDGKISAAPRKDLAEAAAIILSQGGHDGMTLELAGDTGITMTEYSALLSALSGKTIQYKNLPAEIYSGILVSAGIPADMANAIADTENLAAQGWLYHQENTLSSIIGRPTTPIAATISAALAQTGNGSVQTARHGDGPGMRRQ